MQKSILIGLLIIWVNMSSAQNVPPYDKTDRTTLSIEPKVGYSISKSSFNIAGNEMGRNPNIYSELIWDPTNSVEYGVALKLSRKKLSLRTDLLFNKTLSGNVTDFDYDGDNRTLPFTELYLSNHNGTGYSIKIQPGYDVSRNENLSLVTYLSFDYSNRNLYLLNDRNWRSNDRNYIPGLNSYYKYKFPNYGLGIALDYKLSSRWSTQIAAEGYLSRYYAYGHWNLIEDFEKPISYEHKDNGKKISTLLGLSYAINSNVNVGISYDLNHFNISNGKDYLYSKSEGLLKTRLNEANETKHAFLLNLRYSLPFSN
jgi:hypothetical protein